MKFSKSLKEQGFTLVELMVVVAIIGILSAVAIPNFKRYQAKTKTSEAKLQLSSIYSALTALQSDYDGYGDCLTYAGYSAPTANNYYAVGFSANTAAANAIVRANAGGAVTDCPDNQFRFPGRKNVGGGIAVVGWMTSIPVTITVAATGVSFTAGAIGPIDPANNAAASADAWTIDEDKTLANPRRGY
jgi:type IV pilus assembly protein PilA